MPETRPTCVLLADRHHGLTEGVRGLLETAFKTVVTEDDEASLLVYFSPSGRGFGRWHSILSVMMTYRYIQQLLRSSLF